MTAAPDRMLPPLLQSLRFRIAAAVILLAVLMLGAALHTIVVVREEQALGLLLHTSGQLQLTVQTLEKQGLNYLENAPRDYPTYYRDVKLFYADLKAHVETFDMFTDAFMKQSFGPEMTGLGKTIYADLDDITMAVVRRVEDTWSAYRTRLMERLGPDTDEPRLEWAAQFIVDNSIELEEATDELATVVRRQVDSRVDRIAQVNTVLLLFYVAVSVFVVLWFFRHLIRPLYTTTHAFQRVAQGDFGYQVPVSGNDEIASLTESFNRLSRRIHGLVELTTRIQRGSDLDETLRFISEDFPGLIPVDWVGMLFAMEDGQVRLERAYSGGRPVISSPIAFPSDTGLLAKSLQTTDTLHTPIGTEMSSGDDFARWLYGQKVRDAILLPVREETPQVGILVIGARKAGSYSADHLELMRNIGLLVSLSFARTVQLVERTRLAAIGEFTTGIVHELRTPLATVALALDYLRGTEMSPASARRVALASEEADRMSRLLSDVLQYARPLTLNLTPVDAHELVRRVIGDHEQLRSAGRSIELTPADTLPAIVNADVDRLTQVILNLTTNALEASPADGIVSWQVVASGGSVRLIVSNAGEAIAPSQRERVFEPFFTTKAGGTGLGLSIVKRIVDAHGGDITVESGPDATSFSIRLPRPAGVG